jgi:hypothetical protein
VRSSILRFGWRLALACPSTSSRPRPAPGFFEFRVELKTPESVIPHFFEYQRHRTEGLATNAVHPVLTICVAFHEARLKQHPKLKRHRAERDVRHRVVDSARREVPIPEESQDLAATRGNDGRQKGAIHAPYERVY